MYTIRVMRLALAYANLRSLGKRWSGEVAAAPSKEGGDTSLFS
jgi:hypothetical protein